ncbi:MAG: succinyl-diaminopimelate desuccinylase [Planctomycetota bacterium]
MAAAPESLTKLVLELLNLRSEIGNEAEIANFVEARLRAKLTDVRRIGNAIVAFGPRRGRPLVALAGHLDTVFGAPDDPNAPRIVNDRIFGLGASDMKAAIACDLWLLENCDITKCEFDLCFVFYDREEGPLSENGLLKLWSTVPELKTVDLAICGEPTDNAVQLGCVGSVHFKVIFRGRAAHSARPWQGDNAVHKSWKLLKALSEAPVREAVIDELTFRDVMSVTLAQGGRSRNVIPDLFELNINARFAPDSSVENVQSKIASLAGGAEITVVDSAAGAKPNRYHPIIKLLIERTGARVEPKQAWTDVAQFAERGIAAINFGPGEQAQAHQRGEGIAVEAISAYINIKKRFLNI